MPGERRFAITAHPKTLPPATEGAAAMSVDHAAIEAALRNDPALSDRAVGRLIGCDGKTVGAVRRAMRHATPSRAADSRPLADARLRCKACGSLTWWQDQQGAWRCFRCHPPRNASAVFQMLLGPPQ